MEYIKLILKGIVLGVANVIPGVSGGTMAVVFNVYDKIIELICPNVKKILKAWKFWVPLAVGMGIGILAFSKLITLSLGRFPLPTMSLFIGLILGSTPLIWNKVKTPLSVSNKNEENKENAKRPSSFLIVLSFAIGLALIFAMIIFGDADIDSAKTAAKESALALQSALDIKTVILLFVAGAAAAVAMIIPGISGSFLLLALGMYGTIMAAISRLDIIFLLPFALGVIAGLIFGAALVRFLMAKIPSYTYSAILGLILGSIILLCRNLPISTESAKLEIIAFVTLFIGFEISYLSSKRELKEAKESKK